MSEMINGYELLQPLQNQNAGFCKWTFVRRYGHEYFLKEFVDPVYPEENALSPELRDERIRICKDYEESKKKLYRAINEASDGGAVRIWEFFRSGSRYYIVMTKVVNEGIDIERITSLPMEDRMLILKSAAHSLMLLHRANVVHSDVKPGNFLIKRTAKGKYVTRIIDFDCSFLESDPPDASDDLGGDQVYLAPEAVRFMFGEDVKITTKADVFALGLLFHQYLTGSLPEFDTGEYDYACEAVLDGQEILPSPSLEDHLREMIGGMLKAEPEERWDMEKVFRCLCGESAETAVKAEIKTAPEKKEDPGGFDPSNPWKMADDSDLW
ncbi:MAG: protein kinase [Eubacterium sp.]|nr:protein kinase [Eubacterium sp.]